VDEPTSVERWLPIPGFPGYQVSDHGRVWSSARSGVRSDGRTWRVRGRILRPFPARDGYPQVQIVSDAGKHISRKLHVLVLETFVGECPMGMEACHGDDDHTNARLSNLRWATRSANMSDRRRLARPRTGRSHVELSSDRRAALRLALRSKA
jgi:hypothetical protein